MKYDETDWFEGSTKPWESGLYKRWVYGQAFWSWYDKESRTWFKNRTTKELALIAYNADYKSYYQQLQWRGLRAAYVPEKAE